MAFLQNMSEGAFRLLRKRVEKTFIHGGGDEDDAELRQHVLQEQQRREGQSAQSV